MDKIRFKNYCRGLPRHDTEERSQNWNKEHPNRPQQNLETLPAMAMKTI
jgi:hypothetical protein